MTTHIIHFSPSAKKVTNPKSIPVEVTFEDGMLSFDGVAQPESVLEFVVFYGTKQKLADTYSSHVDQADFEGKLLKGKDKAKEWEFRDADAPIGGRAKMARDIAMKLLARYATKSGMKLPAKSTDKYKDLLAKFTKANAARIETDTARQWDEEQALDVSGLTLELDVATNEAPGAGDAAADA